MFLGCASPHGWPAWFVYASHHEGRPDARSWRQIVPTRRRPGPVYRMHGAVPAAAPSTRARADGELSVPPE